MQSLDHIALVTPRIETVLERLAPLNLASGPIEEFADEGTREVYLGEPQQAARLLLIQPLDDRGPYARALARRGPGLHHVARAVPDLDAHLRALSGWLLHPHSATSIPAHRTAWLARPGVEFLLELTEGPPPSQPALVEHLTAPSQAQAALIEALGLQAAHEAVLTLSGMRWAAAELAGEKSCNKRTP